MSRFLRFCAFLSVLFLTSNVFAAGYTCPTAKKYTSCAANYYVSDCGTTYDGRTLASSSLTSGNSCNSCPSGYTCSGGLVCPRSATVTVTFQTGSTRLGTQTFTSGTAKNLTALTSLPNYTAPVSSTYGWTFAGWASSVGTTTIAYTDAASATFTADTTLYAVWKRTITVKYIGTATATTISTGTPVQYYRNTSTTVAAPGAITFPALVESTRYGWKPIGWSHDDTASASVPDTTITQHAMQLKPTEKNVYYAVYERALTLAYAGNGSTSGSTASHSIDQWFNAGSGTLSNNTRLIAAANGFTRTNYWFNGWNTKADGSDIAYDEGASVTLPTTWNTAQSMTLYAQWGANITCDAGKYLPKNTTTCASCPAGYYCEGGTFPRNTVDQGLTGVCASGYSTGGASTSACTACASGYAASGTAYTDHDAIGDCKRTITLNKNGGSGTIQGASGTTSATITCSQGSACDFGSASGLSQTCYTFTGGWGTSASCTATTTSFTTPTSSTYYACKNQKDVTVTFVGTNTIGQQTFKCGTAQNLTAAADMPAPVEDNGWTFAGWSTAQDGTPELADQASFAPQADTTLYGVWSRPVTFKYYDGATATGVTTAQRTQYFYGGSPTSVSTYALATQSSYSWAPVGWVLNSTSGTTTASTATTTAANVTPSPIAAANYYALYKRTATVAYNGNTNTGGSTSSTTGTQYFNAGSSAANALGLVLATNGFTKTGYSFSKWASGSTSGTQYAVGAKFTFPNTAWSGSSTHTMYATWTANTYTVAYDANGGSGTTASSSHTYGTSKALTANGFTNGVKKFLGWSTSSTATSATYTNKQSVSNLTTTNGATVTLYAVWGTCTACSAGTGATCSLSAPLGVCTYTTSCLDGYNTISNSGAYNPSCKANTYTVAYDANGGSGTTASSSHTYGTSKALTANGFTNGVKKFLGWSTSSTATSATYTNKQSVSNLTTTNGGTVTLYAVWGTCTACSAGTGATCSLSAPLGVCTYTTSCKTGYNTISNSGAYNPVCAANAILIGLNKNGGSGTCLEVPEGATAGLECTYDSDCILPSWNSTTCNIANGYNVFTGWNTAADGSGTTYAPGANVKNITSGDAIMLYAMWSETQCNVTNGVYVKQNTTNNKPTCKVICNTGYQTSGTYQGTAGTTTVTYACTAIKSTVSFDANGGTGGQSAAVTATYGSAMPTISTTKPTRTGYTFMGWYDNATYTSGTQYYTAAGASARSWNKTAATTLYAGWKPNEYTITLDAGGVVTSGTLYTKYNTGVYTDSARTTAMSTTANGIASTLLPPKTATVTLNANGGSVSQTSAGVTLTCRGYYSAVSGGTQYIGAAGKITTDGLTAGKGYTANKTWYAQWIPGSYALPTPTRTGYTFNGWATSSSATSGATGSYSVTGDVTLYATWTANLTGAIDLLSRAYSSTSDTTGMSLTTSAMPTPVYIRYNTGVYTSTATSATAITKLTTMPALTGYTFQGFYTGKAGTGTQVIDASGNFTSAVKTLYPTAGQVAEWYPHFTANCNQVVLNANGGTAGTTATLYRRTNETKFYTNSACTTTTAQSAILPTRDGYKFRGFYTLNMADVSADTAESTDVRIIGSLGGQTTVGDSWKITGAETLYAAWAKNCAAGTKATCSLSVGDGVDYATGCDTGYNFKSGANTYAPVCQANTYSVTYNPRASRLGGGSWAASVREYTYDTEYFLPTAGEFWGSYMPLGSYVEYEGKRFTFLGWTRDISSDVTDTDLDILNTGTKKAWNLTAENGGTVNLYAVWSECAICMPGLGATCYLTDTTTCQYETACKTGFKNLTNSGTYNPRCEPIEYTVRYASNCDGATGTMANVAFDYTDVFNPSTNGYTCGTKKFLGWANTANCDLTLEDGAICTEVDYEPGEEYDALTETDGDQVILLAVWGECTACLNNTPGASCTLSAPKGVCTYTTACLLGYHGLNNGGTNFPSCSANTYTVKYDMNCPSGVTCSSAPSSTACTYDQRCTFSSISSTSLYAGGYKLLGWASTTTGTPTTNGINLAVADAEVVTRYAIWESCTSGYYHPAATGTAANVCTAAADGKFVAGNAATAAVSCATGSYSEKSSASTKCVACPAGRTTAGTGTKYNATANTACATTCSNATGVYTWATPSWSNNTVANLCTVTSCSSKYYLNSATTNKACALCSDLADTNGFYPNSDNGNNTSAAACYTNSLSGQYVKSSGDAAATDCPNWTYKGAHSVRFGTVSTCDSCLTVPSAVNNVAWTKASGTKWTSYSQCVVTQTPANCASGSVKRTQTDASTWGSTTLASTLKSKAGYYAGTSALACTICPSGSYCPASATTATKCATGSYSSTNGASVCVACQDGTTTSGTGQTSCNATCSNATGVSDWETASWTTSNTVTSLCTIAATAGCSADYYKNSNACATCSSGTSGKYTKSAAGTTSVNSCYLVTTAGKYVATKGAGETACISPYYCKGGTTVYYGTGTTTGGHTACSGLGSIYTKSDASASAATQCYATTTPGKYVTAKATAEATCPAGDWCEGSVKVYYGSAGGNTDCPSGYTNGTTGYSAQSQCLMNVAGGKYVATEKESSASGTCAKGYAKAAHTVNYGSTSSCSACTGATYAASTGQTSCTACPTATNNASKATGYSYWNAGTTADHTTVAGCYVTYENEPLDDGNMSLYYCYADTDAATTGEYGVDGTSKGCWVYWDKLTCDGGYYNKNYSTSSNYDFTNKTIANLKANACIAVGAGNWSANDALTRTACTSPLTTIGYGTAANEEEDCGRKLHMGSNVVYLRSDKRTTPSLRVKVDGTTFYGALSTSLSSAMKVKNGSTTYSVVNDYQ